MQSMFLCEKNKRIFFTTLKNIICYLINKTCKINFKKLKTE